MRRFFKNTLLVVNIIFAIALLLSYLCQYVSPEKFWPLAFFGLTYPYLLLINFVFIFIWLWRKKWHFLISTLAILLGLNTLNSFVQLPFGKENPIMERDSGLYKIISYNVRLFNLYQWENTPDVGNSIFRFINSEHPGIVCFQEFYVSEKGSLTENGLYKKLKQLPFKHIRFTSSTKTSKTGIATFTAFPIVNMGNIQFDNTLNNCIFTDLKINHDTIRVYNVHLQSIRLDTKDYTFLDSLKLKYDNRQASEFRDISFRLRDAFIKRAQQVDVIAMHIKQSPHKVIVCGDFNDTPASYAYHQMKKGLVDAFRESGSGFGNSYQGRFPSFRIDYILHSPSLQSAGFERTKIKLSDHYPIECHMVFE